MKYTPANMDRMKGVVAYYNARQNTGKLSRRHIKKFLEAKTILAEMNDELDELYLIILRLKQY